MKPVSVTIKTEWGEYTGPTLRRARAAAVIAEKAAG